MQELKTDNLNLNSSSASVRRHPVKVVVNWLSITFKLVYVVLILTWSLVIWVFFKADNNVLSHVLSFGGTVFAQTDHYYILSKIDSNKLYAKVVDGLDSSGDTNLSPNSQNDSIWSDVAGSTDSTKFYAYYSTKDPRIVALEKFLKDHKSPMAPYADLIVKEADKYGMDWRIVVAISGIESNFGTITPANSHNAWGWRGGPGGAYSEFKDWPSAIKHISERLAKGYGKDIDPYAIESTYCPPCGATGQHYWARAVKAYMNQISNYLEKIKGK